MKRSGPAHVGGEGPTTSGPAACRSRRRHNAPLAHRRGRRKAAPARSWRATLTTGMETVAALRRARPMSAPPPVLRFISKLGFARISGVRAVPLLEERWRRKS